MALMVKVYEALRAANVPDEQARAAATEIELAVEAAGIAEEFDAPLQRRLVAPLQSLLEDIDRRVSATLERISDTRQQVQALGAGMSELHKRLKRVEQQLMHPKDG